MTSIAPTRRSHTAPFLAAVAVVIVISNAAYAGMIPPLVASHGLDKVLHAAMGAGLTFLLARVLGGRAWLAAVLVLVPLAIDEYFQRYSPTRSSDWADLAADIVGALVAIGIHRALSRHGSAPSARRAPVVPCS